MNDKELIRQLVDSALNDLKLSDLLSYCFDRNKFALCDCKISTVENILKKFYTESGQIALTDTICELLV